MLIIFTLSFNGKICAEQITISLLVNEEGLPNYIIKELNEIANSAGETKMVISSKQRTVRKQVEVMLDYYITCSKITNIEQKQTCGIPLAKKVYDKECHSGFEVFNKNASRKKNVEKMTLVLTKKLIELGSRRRCMNHVVIPNIKTSIIAVDIKPSSIANHSKFYEAVIKNDNVILFYYPNIKGKQKSEVEDAAFHLGFYRK